MSPRYLLDTSIVSVPAHKHPDPRVVRRLDEQAAECAIAAPVWHELQYWRERCPAGPRREALAAYLQLVLRSFPILPYDQDAAAWHAQERARLEADGRMAPFADGQIAAVAAVQGLALVTANVKHFREFAGLRIENWSKG